MNNFYWIYLIVFLIATPSQSQSKKITEAEAHQQWKTFEIAFETSKQYLNPFMDIEVNVVFKKEDKHWIVPAFWVGAGTWVVRFAPSEVGEYKYHLESTDKKNKDFSSPDESPYLSENSVQS